MQWLKLYNRIPEYTIMADKVKAKEWVAAEQYGEYYNIYRVYFTKTKTIVVRIKNPYKKAETGEIEVFPTIYQMNFGSNVIELRYDK